MEQQTASFMIIVVIVYIWSDQAPEVLGPSPYSRLRFKDSFIPFISYYKKKFIEYDRMDAPIICECTVHFKYEWQRYRVLT